MEDEIQHFNDGETKIGNEFDLLKYLKEKFGDDYLTVESNTTLYAVLEGKVPKKAFLAHDLEFNKEADGETWKIVSKDGAPFLRDQTYLWHSVPKQDRGGTTFGTSLSLKSGERVALSFIVKAKETPIAELFVQNGKLYIHYK